MCYDIENRIINRYINTRSNTVLTNKICLFGEKNGIFFIIFILYFFILFYIIYFIFQYNSKQYKLACAQCSETFTENDIYVHKFRCQSTFADIYFVLSNENMIKVFSREIGFMIAVLENDLASEHEKLKDEKVYRLVQSANSNTLMVTIGMCLLQ